MTFDKVNWWWTSQLLTGLASFIFILRSESSRYDIPRSTMVALSLVGLLGSYAASLSLLFLHISHKKPSAHFITPQISKGTALTLLLAVVSVFVLPYTLQSENYIYNIAFFFVAISMPIFEPIRHVNSQIPEKNQYRYAAQYCLFLMGSLK